MGADHDAGGDFGDLIMQYTYNKYSVYESHWECTTAQLFSSHREENNKELRWRGFNERLTMFIVIYPVS